MKELGANVARVYTVDPTLNHEACMNAFADAGIYVLVDMTTATYSIDRVWSSTRRHEADAWKISPLTSS
jgi:hypothetical protein